MHLDLMTLLVRDYDRAIAFFVEVLQFDLWASTARAARERTRTADLADQPMRERHLPSLYHRVPQRVSRP